MRTPVSSSRQRRGRIGTGLLAASMMIAAVGLAALVALASTRSRDADVYTIAPLPEPPPECDLGIAAAPAPDAVDEPVAIEPAAEDEPAAADEKPPPEELTRLSIVEGRVVDEAGRPVAGIQVRLWSNTESPWQQPSNRADTRTTADGGFRFEETAPGRYWLHAEVPAASDFMQPRALILDIEAGQDSLENTIALTKGYTFEGIVLNQEGSPVEGVWVWPSFGAGTNPRYRDIRTDEEGVFRFAGIYPDSLVTAVTATHPDYYAYTAGELDAETRHVEITLTRRAPVPLRVVYTEDKRPVPRFRYQALGRSGFPRPTSPVGEAESADGTAQMEGIDGGKWEVLVEELDATGVPTGRTGMNFFEKPGYQTSHDEVTVEVSPAGVLEGVVVLAPDNRPVSGANVSLGYGLGRSGALLTDRKWADVTTLDDGRFVFANLPVGEFTLKADPPPGLMAYSTESVRVHHPLGPSRHTLTVYEPSVIYGEVIGRDGEPLSDAKVVCTEIIFRMCGMAPPPEPEVIEGRVDARGDYRIEVRDRGMGYTVRVEHPDAQYGVERRVEVGRGTSHEVNFDFSGSIRLYGVIDMDNALFNRTGYIRLGAEDYSNIRSPFQLDADGNYHVDVMPGDYRIEVSVPGTNPVRNLEVARFSVAHEPESQQRDFDLALTPVSIALVFPGKAVFARGDLILESTGEMSPGGHDSFRIFAGNPSVVVPHFPEGVYTARFAAYNGRWQGDGGTIRVTHGEDNLVVIDVSRVESTADDGDHAAAQ